MTNYIFPTFQGWSFNTTLTPYWKTATYEAESGREARIQKWSYPRYKIELNYNFLTDNSIEDVSLLKGDLERLLGFFNSVGGSFNDFLYKDSKKNSVENQVFAVAKGDETQFQLVRNIETWVEPIKGIVEAPHIFIDGVETTDFSFDNYGRINFATAPGSAESPVELTWTGGFYFRCRFEDDDLPLTQTWDGLWEDITVKLVTVK